MVSVPFPLWRVPSGPFPQPCLHQVNVVLSSVFVKHGARCTALIVLPPPPPRSEQSICRSAVLNTVITHGARQNIFPTANFPSNKFFLLEKLQQPHTPPDPMMRAGGVWSMHIVPHLFGRLDKRHSLTSHTAHRAQGCRASRVCAGRVASPFGSLGSLCVSPSFLHCIRPAF